MLNSQRIITLERDYEHLARALDMARHSPDPATQVGAVIASRHGVLVAAGFNALPPGLAPTLWRMLDRETKLKLIVHAEMSAICCAARHGRIIEGGTLYLAATDDTDLVWGGPPCTRCTVHLIQAGITTVVSYRQKPGPSKWHDDLNFARDILVEAHVTLLELPV